MAYRLRFTSGKSKGSSFVLEPGRVLTIGRSPSNDICIPDTKISRIHCQVELADGKCNLTDLNSSNGTFVDGQRVDEAVLEDGDSFHLGFTTAVFEQFGEKQAAAEEEDKEGEAKHPRIVLCSECGRAILESDIRKGDARKIGAGVYCSVCAKEFADVELVEEGEADAAQAPDAKLMETNGAIDPLIGQIVAGNELVERIAEGPMGNMYSARQLSMDRAIALRVLARGPETTDDVLEQMIDRARLTGRLSHPHVLVIHDQGHDGNLYYVSMELIDGDSVRDLLLKQKRLMLPEALYIACHAARALECARSQGQVHGEVHPGNILVSKLGHAKLSDFGPIPEAMMQKMRPNQQLAYLRYASPERLAGRKFDITSDIYSLGATLYHMICGSPPVDAESVEELRERVLHEEPPPPSTINSDIPRAIDALLMRMLAKSPKDRYASPGALSRKLRSLVRELRAQHKAS